MNSLIIMIELVYVFAAPVGVTVHAIHLFQELLRG